MNLFINSTESHFSYPKIIVEIHRHLSCILNVSIYRLI